MDPDKLLEDIRTLADQILNTQEVDVEGSQMSIELAEKIIQLDEWLSHFGFLPKDWRRSIPVSE
jgi:hypothetical protein